MGELVEMVAFKLWLQEAIRAAPNVAKHRTIEAFRNDTSEAERARWIASAQAIIPIVTAACAEIVRNHARLWSDEDVTTDMERIAREIEGRLGGGDD